MVRHDAYLIIDSRCHFGSGGQGSSVVDASVSIRNRPASQCKSRPNVLLVSRVDAAVRGGGVAKVDCDGHENSLHPCVRNIAVVSSLRPTYNRKAIHCVIGVASRCQLKADKFRHKASSYRGAGGAQDRSFLNNSFQ